MAAPKLGININYNNISRRKNAPTAEQLNELERNIGYWESSTAVCARPLENLTAAADVVLFLEQFPSNVHEWLRKQMAIDGNAAESACGMVERNLRET